MDSNDVLPKPIDLIPTSLPEHR